MYKWNLEGYRRDRTVCEIIFESCYYFDGHAHDSIIFNLKKQEVAAWEWCRKNRVFDVPYDELQLTLFFKLVELRLNTFMPSIREESGEHSTDLGGLILHYEVPPIDKALPQAFDLFIGDLPDGATERVLSSIWWHLSTLDIHEHLRRFCRSFDPPPHEHAVMAEMFRHVAQNLELPMCLAPVEW
jgi:hypothetical protein